MTSIRALEVGRSAARLGERGALDLYDQAASIVAMGAFECDLASERLSWTPGVFDLFGLTPDQHIERQQTVAMYSEESRALLERKRAHAIATRTGFSLDARIVRTDGVERWIRINASVRGANGRSEALFGMKQDITEERERWEVLRALAECDPLTGVANRVRFQQFMDRSSDELALDRIGALVLFDLDGFKPINDRWGHAAGDQCLIAFGDRLRKALPQARLISRIGGDEFAVLLPPASSRERSEGTVRWFIDNFLTPVPWDGDLLPLSVSAGMAFATGVAGLDPQTLFIAADKALYDAKRDPTTMLVCA